MVRNIKPFRVASYILPALADETQNPNEFHISLKSSDNSLLKESQSFSSRAVAYLLDLS